MQLGQATKGRIDPWLDKNIATGEMSQDRRGSTGVYFVTNYLGLYSLPQRKITQYAKVWGTK